MSKASSAPATAASSVPVIDHGPPFGLVEGREYQRQHPGQWPSWECLRWQMRQHRAVLVEAGAVLLWRGCLVIDPEKFENAMREVMRRGAMRVLERSRGNGNAR